MSVHSSGGARWKTLRVEVLERDSYVCQHCGGIATEADHITPKSKGGLDQLDNLIASCKPCNARRGAKDLLRRTWFNTRHLPEGVW